MVLKSRGHVIYISLGPLHTFPSEIILALVVADGRATNYVDGVQQLTGEMPYRPATEGITSVGVRQNKVCWFKGDLYRIRITPRALTPDEFLRDQERLNRE